MNERIDELWLEAVDATRTDNSKSAHEKFAELIIKEYTSNVANANTIRDADRYRTLMHHCDSSHIWYHVLSENYHTLGDDVESVLDALSAKDRELS